MEKELKVANILSSSLLGLEKHYSHLKFSPDSSLVAKFSNEVIYIYNVYEYFKGLTSNPVLMLNLDEVSLDKIGDIHFVNNETKQ